MPSDAKRVPGLGSALVFAYLNRSFCHAQLGQFDKARADGQKAMQLDPSAIHNAFTQAIANEPSQPIHYQNRAWFFLELQDWRAALADCDKAIELDCTQAFSFNQRASAHAGLKNFEQALADYTRALELDPGQPMTYFSRAGVHQALGNPADAAADYSEAIRLDRELGNSTGNVNLPWKLRGGNQLPDRN
jgi:serine/threonine-protein kinase